MMKRTKLRDRELPDYTRGEEIFNMTSHIAGGAFAIAALVLCVVWAARKGNVWGVVSGAIYGSTMIVLYAMSSIYHGLPKDRMAKRVFQVIDHCSIFFLIAGTYTPITLGGIRTVNAPLAWTLFGVIWGVAALGITLNAIDLKSFRTFSLICYLMMGWCVVAAVRPMIQAVGAQAFWLLIYGGVCYTAGALIYAFMKGKPYAHSVFHLLVLAGSVLHFFCILLYIM